MMAAGWCRLGKGGAAVARLVRVLRRRRRVFGGRREWPAVRVAWAKCG